MPTSFDRETAESLLRAYQKDKKGSSADNHKATYAGETANTLGEGRLFSPERAAATKVLPALLLKYWTGSASGARCRIGGGREGGCFSEGGFGRC